MAEVRSTICSNPLSSARFSYAARQVRPFEGRDSAGQQSAPTFGCGGAALGYSRNPWLIRTVDLLTTDPADERRYKREELKAETALRTLRAPVNKDRMGMARRRGDLQLNQIFNTEFTEDTEQRRKAEGLKR